MHPALIIIPVVLAVGALIGIIIFAVQKYEKARTEEFRLVAKDMGLQFVAEGTVQIKDEVAQLRLFNQGHSRKFKNMLYGTANGVDMAIFEYRYTTGHGKHQQTHQQSVIYFRSPKLALPHFELRPEGFFHRISQAFGYQDIDFDTHPRFSKAYLLRGEDEAAVRSVFTPERLEQFETLERVSVEAARDRLVFYRQGKRIKPDEVRSLMTDGFRVFKTFEPLESL